MKKKLLIITIHQFGYQTDYYNWCSYLVDKFNITYFEFDYCKPKIEMDGVTKISISSKGSFLLRNYRYYLKLQKILKANQYSNIVVTGSNLAFIPRLFTLEKKVLFDLRSIAVHDSKLKRLVYNLINMFCLRIYFHNSIITDNIRKFYKLSLRRCTVLPIGANILSTIDKSFDVLNLLYIGVIRQGFDRSIFGFKKFHDNHPHSTYTIIGDKEIGGVDTARSIVSTIESLNLSNNVKFLGRLQHIECRQYFDRCNVGVSFIPVKPYFDNQPPTKNYEYMLSGMACIATCTSANKKMIFYNNGVIIKDSADSFAEGLEDIYKRKQIFNSKIIRALQHENTWENIVSKILLPLLDSTSN